MKLFVFLISFFVALPVIAQTDELRDEPGYVDFGEMSAAYGEPKIEINIGSALLGFVGALADDDDPEVAAIFDKLKAVRVNVYKVDDATAAIDHISDVASELKSRSWIPIVTVRDEGEHVRIFVKMTGDKIDGLTVMAAEDDDEAVFINVIGEIDPDDLSKVTDTLDIDL
jgi:hypothetical protein